MFSFRTAGFAAVFTAFVLLGRATVAATPASDVPVIDLRDATSSAIKKKVSSLKPKGLTLLYSGSDARMADIVREVSAQSAAAGYPVLRVILARAGSSEGGTFLKPSGESIGTMIPASADLRTETRARVAIFASERAGAQCSPAPATGSIMRQKRVCTIPPRQPAARAAPEQAPMHPGGDATEPVPGN
jgi:hypothetical protein